MLVCLKCKHEIKIGHVRGQDVVVKAMLRNIITKEKACKQCGSTDFQVKEL
jgi:hypothetical protein